MKTIKFTIYKKCMSLLSATSSNGSSFTTAYSSTVDSSIFLWFIKSLFEYYSKRIIRDCWEVLVIMDNCPYQTSNSTIDQLKKWRINALYLPPYWQELAPVELMFRSLKSKLKSIREKMHKVLIAGRNWAYFINIKRIRSNEILSYWSQFYK